MANILPKVGVCVFIINNGKILLGKRKNSHGSSTWATPGGHLEFGETPEQCAKREVNEEVGIKIKNLRKGPYSNDLFIGENKHYITLCMIADYSDGQVQLLEPEKCESWNWFDLHELPTPLFLPITNFINEYGGLKKIINSDNNG